MKIKNLRSCVRALLDPGNLFILQRAVTAAAFRLLRLVFCVFQAGYWQLNGTAKQLREARLPEHYDRSAQVLDVLLFYMSVFRKWRTTSALTTDLKVRSMYLITTTST